jgi:hypothetical protein
MDEPTEVFVESIDVILVLALIADAAYRYFSGVSFRDAMFEWKSKSVVE